MERDKFIALLAKKFAGKLSDNESSKLEDYIDSNDSYRLLATQLEAYFNERVIRQIDPIHLAKIWAKVEAHEQEELSNELGTMKSKQYFLASISFKVAAILVLAIGLGWFTYNSLTRSEVIVTVAAGDRKVFKMLGDGTAIWINKNSSISYNEDFGELEREITLEGEAYFEVAKNKAVPLFVHAGGIDIEVKGTAFNVNAYAKNENIEVALIRGAISVSERAHTKNNILLKPYDKLVFSARMSASETAFQIIALNSNALRKESSWTADTLSFSKEKFGDLVLKFEHKYDVKIEILSESLKEKRFTGTFTTENLDQALAALKLSYPFTYTIKKRLVTIND